MNETNPLLKTKTDKYNSIPFTEIKSEHFLPAIKICIKDTEKNIENICKSEVPANFENTIISFENAFNLLEHVVTIYYHYFASVADDDIRKLVGEVSTMNTKLNNDIYLNEILFSKIKSVYDNRNNFAYSKDDLRLLDEIYSSFLRNGANLNESDKSKGKAGTSNISKYLSVNSN